MRSICIEHIIAKETKQQNSIIVKGLALQTVLDMLGSRKPEAFRGRFQTIVVLKAREYKGKKEEEKGGLYH